MPQKGPSIHASKLRDPYNFTYFDIKFSDRSINHSCKIKQAIRSRVQLHKARINSSASLGMLLTVSEQKSVKLPKAQVFLQNIQIKSPKKHALCLGKLREVVISAASLYIHEKKGREPGCKLYMQKKNASDF